MPRNSQMAGTWLSRFAIEPLGDVEHEIGLRVQQRAREVARGREADHLTHSLERGGDGLDGLGLVPLGVEIGLAEVGAKGPTRGDAVERGDGGIAGFLRRRQRRLLIEGEPYSNRQLVSLIRL